MVSQTILYVKNSAAAMLMQDRNVRTAGQNFTALADVQQMHTMHQDRSEVSMSLDVNYLENVLSVRS